ncbi:hypothetical protein WMF26_16650 [Sorangium sp. So ce185]|uniref:hypothetical protein n=1 Tax=Sorangium sp. So ce185 TaxID=3133287 RepID=UPI003F61696F
MKTRTISAALLTTLALSTGFLGCADDADDGEEASSTSTSSVSGSASSGVGGDGGCGADGGSGGGGGGDGGGGDGGSGDGGSGGGGSGGGYGDGGLGARCELDADCGPSGICLSASGNEFFGGGPAGGYCTTSCAADGDCEGEGSACVEGICLLGCPLGNPPLVQITDELDPGKCHGREDLRCDSIGDVSVCMPSCGMDSQCAGRACDPRINLCVDEPTTGLPAGSPCEVGDEGIDPCAGWCVPFGPELGVCAGLCALGGDIANEDCGGLRSGMCVYALKKDPGIGDTGACAKACTTHGDCLMPHASCTFVGQESNGFCVFGPTKCPRGQGDCRTAGEVCAETPDGPLCLDERYPLNDAGAGGAGGAGGAEGSGGAGGTGGAGEPGGAGGAGGAAGAGGAGARP